MLLQPFITRVNSVFINFVSQGVAHFIKNVYNRDENDEYASKNTSV